MSKAKPDAKSVGGYAPRSFANLLAVAADNASEPPRIALDDIDEDPDQPRKTLDMSDLEPLAATIRSHGVLQPVGVYPAVDGRYRLAFGARRVRASRIAGKLDIPVVIIDETQQNFASQVIENQQRSDLSNSDLTAAIVQLQAAGASATDIMVICNLKEYQVTAYRAVAKFPEFLKERIDTADVRALYDLYRQWTKTPAAIEAKMPEGDAFLTITEARRMIEGAVAMSSGAPISDRPADANDADERDGRASPSSGNDVAVPELDEILHAEIAPASAEKPMVKPVNPPVRQSTDDEQPELKSPTFIVAIGDGERGQLVVDRRATAPGWALVRFSTGIEEVEFTALRTIAIE